jgi:hypothetical protein
MVALALGDLYLQNASRASIYSTASLKGSPMRIPLSAANIQQIPSHQAALAAILQSGVLE